MGAGGPRILRHEAMWVYQRGTLAEMHEAARSGDETMNTSASRGQPIQVHKQQQEPEEALAWANCPPVVAPAGAEPWALAHAAGVLPARMQALGPGAHRSSGPPPANMASPWFGGHLCKGWEHTTSSETPPQGKDGFWKWTVLSRRMARQRRRKGRLWLGPLADLLPTAYRVIPTKEHWTWVKGFLVGTAGQHQEKRFYLWLSLHYGMWSPGIKTGETGKVTSEILALPNPLLIKTMKYVLWRRHIYGKLLCLT